MKFAAPRSDSQQTLNLGAKYIAALRIGFGLIWLVDAALKYQPAFYNGILDAVQSADSGGPHWLDWWYNAWFAIIGSNPHVFAVIVVVIETLITLALLLGVARRINYLLGAVFSFLIWSVAEGFGGPYTVGATDISAGLIYSVVFLLIYVAEASGLVAWTLDPWLEQRLTWWHVIAEPKLGKSSR